MTARSAQPKVSRDVFAGPVTELEREAYERNMARAAHAEEMLAHYRIMADRVCDAWSLNEAKHMARMVRGMDDRQREKLVGKS